MRVEALTPGPVEDGAALAGTPSTALGSGDQLATIKTAQSKCVTLVVQGWGAGALPVARPSSVTLYRSVTDGAPSVTFELPVGAHVVLSPPPTGAGTEAYVRVAGSSSAPTPADGEALSAPPTFSIESLPDNSTEYHWLGYRQKVTDMVMQCSGDWPS